MSTIIPLLALNRFVEHENGYFAWFQILLDSDISTNIILGFEAFDTTNIVQGFKPSSKIYLTRIQVPWVKCQPSRVRLQVGLRFSTPNPTQLFKIPTQAQPIFGLSSSWVGQIEPDLQAYFQPIKSKW